MRLPTITGEFRTTAEPELRFTTSGKAVASVTVIATESKRSQDGQGWEDGDSTPFLNVSLWDAQAEALVEANIAKGERVLVTGQLFVRKYQRNDGTEGQSVEIKYATVAQVPGGKPKGAGGGQPQQRQGYAHGQQPQRRQQAEDPWNSAGATSDPWASGSSQSDTPPF